MKTTADILKLGAVLFNDQIKSIHNLVGKHPCSQLLTTDLARCPPSETHFLGNRTEFLKTQMEASKLTDPVKKMTVTRYQPRTFGFSRGGGLLG